jgi:hypothetical protein
MTPYLIALALAGIAVLTVPLAAVAVGIHRQEHAPSLADRPAGVTAALTGRLLALHAAPAPARQCATPAPAARPAATLAQQARP